MPLKLSLSAPQNPLRRLRAETPRVGLFAIATLAPLLVLALGAVLGGTFAWGALALTILMAAGLDAGAAQAAPDAPRGAAFPGAHRLTLGLAAVHFAALALALFALTGGTGLTAGSRFAVLLGFGLFFGQVSTAAAHELIHRADPRLFRLGMWVHISMLAGHHTSAHRLVHHHFAATPDDPNSAQSGESFWDFAPRAWVGSFVAGYEMEQQLRVRVGGDGVAGWLHRINPYAVYLGGVLVFAVWVAVLFGAGGLLAWLALSALAQVQMLLADYVQHYGLGRRRLGLDRFEAIGPQHSWDAPHPVSSLWMLNAPRHSDHHAHPEHGFAELRMHPVRPGRPILPGPLPAMMTLALVPPLWRRVMDPRVAALRRTR